jgi:hypothetical protein
VGFCRAVDDAALNAGLIGRGFGFTGHAEAHEVCGRSAEGEAAAESVTSYCRGKPAYDGALDRIGRGAGAPGRGVLMEHGGGKLAECGDGLAGAEDVSEEARAGGKISGRRSKAAPLIPSSGMSLEKSFSMAGPIMFSG